MVMHDFHCDGFHFIQGIQGVAANMTSGTANFTKNGIDTSQTVLMFV